MPGSLYVYFMRPSGDVFCILIGFVYKDKLEIGYMYIHVYMVRGYCLLIILMFLFPCIICDLRPFRKYLRTNCSAWKFEFQRF